MITRTTAGKLQHHIRTRSPVLGFTLVEMIMVIVITGIIGGIVAMFIRVPMQGYVDSARRAEMTDIADTALRRMSRDLRLALPNSVRVNQAGGIFYIDFLSTSGGGRYRSSAPGNILDFSTTDTSFEVLGTAPTCAAGIDQIVVYNLGITGADVYNGDNRATCTSVGPGSTINIAPAKQFPFESPTQRFHVVNEQVRYICDPTNNSLRRYWWPANGIVPPVPAVPGAGNNALLADNVGGCNFAYDLFVVAQRAGLVTMQLTITQSNESVTLYNATHVSNEP